MLVNTCALYPGSSIKLTTCRVSRSLGTLGYDILRHRTRCLQRFHYHELKGSDFALVGAAVIPANRPHSIRLAPRIG